MIAITVRQPWATWLVMGVKVYETRGWSCHHRGLIAIHAGRHWDKDIEAFTQHMLAKYPQLRPADDLFPLGGVVGVCKITAVYDAGQLSYKLGRMESELGDFSEGRRAWRMEEAEIYAKPIWCAGKQSLWQWNGRGAGEASYGKV